MSFRITAIILLALLSVNAAGDSQQPASHPLPAFHRGKRSAASCLGTSHFLRRTHQMAACRGGGSSDSGDQAPEESSGEFSSEARRRGIASEESGEEEGGGRNLGAEEDVWGQAAQEAAQEAALVARGTRQSIVEELQRMGSLRTCLLCLKDAVREKPLLSSFASARVRFEVVTYRSRSEVRKGSVSGIPFSPNP
ncbi:hypothetical protein T484DRAFT_3629941 [Baffinella frigidus]|nr:hypothetical protein T484DRAFT_3629941 [Cryptophyta sp. CCMP2293]